MERAFVCNQTPGRVVECPVLPSGALGSSRGEAASGLAVETVRPRSEDVLCDLRRALWVQAQTSPRGFSAPGSRRGLCSPWRQSLPFLFLETREAATWEERRESPHGAAQVKRRWGSGDSKGAYCGSETGRRSLSLHVRRGHLLPGEPTQPLPTWRTKGLGSTVGVGERRWRDAGRQAVGAGEGACLHFLSGPNDGELHAASASSGLFPYPEGLGCLT